MSKPVCRLPNNDDVAAETADVRQPRALVVKRSASNRRVPGGLSKSSPALQCWVWTSRGDASRQGRWNFSQVVRCRERLPEIVSIVPPGRIGVYYPYPAINCWATFIGSRRDESLERRVRCSIPWLSTKVRLRFQSFPKGRTPLVNANAVRTVGRRRISNGK
jgi:hypothetical protein